MSVSEKLLSVDFAALRTVRLVHRLGSFTAAAEAIDVKQSTVSYTVDRLRKALADPLFVRRGGRVVPTARFRDLLPVIERLLAEAENLEGGDSFEPALSRTELTLACTSFSVRVLVPCVLRRLRREAPGIRLNLAVGYHDAGPTLLDGSVDLALSVPGMEASGIYSDDGILEDYDVCLMDPANPLAGRELTVDDLAGAWQVLAEPWPNFKQPHVRASERLGIAVNRAAVTTSASEVGDLVVGTDLIGALPSRMAEKWRGQLAFARFPMPTDIRLNLYWSAANHRSKLITWMREVIRDEARRLGPPMQL